MATRKVEVNVTVKLKMVVEEGQEIGDILDEIDYDFSDTTGNADVEDMEIVGYEIVDSR